MEFSCAFPILLTLVVGVIIIGVGVSRYQMVALLARQGARWASVRGDEYQKTTGKAAASASDVYSLAVLPGAVGMDSSSVSCAVAWSPDNQPGSSISVTVSYRWSPIEFVGPMTMSSTSVMTMTY